MMGMISYADDITTLTSHPKIETAEHTIQPYWHQLHQWTQDNDLQLNATKSTCTLFTPDPAEYNSSFNLQIHNITIPTTKHSKILGLTFDPKLNYSEHIKIIKEKANNTTTIIKALTGTKWGKQKETLVT